MDAILIKSRYKVTHVLQAQQDYAACLAVDIESREKTEYLLNIYEGALGRRYVDSFDKLRHCSEYAGMFMADGALVAVFSAAQAEEIDRVFFKGADIAWDERLRYAQLVMHLALSVSDFPPQIGCAALLSRNLLIRKKTGKVSVNYVVLPMEDMNARELVYLLTDQIEKILLKRFSSADAEIEFVRKLKSGAFTSVPPLYSHWLEAKKEIETQYERINKKSSLQRVLYLCFLNLKRWCRRVFLKNGNRRGEARK